MGCSLLRKLLLLALIVFSLCILVPGQVNADGGRNIILIHGWNGNPTSWNTAKAAYQANGDTVHVLSMPKNSLFMRSGDAVVNAKYVQTYIQQNHLTNVVLDGHSLGAMESLYIATVLREPAVVSVVMRDTGFISGFSCYLIPDLCSTSSFANAIRNATQTSVPILHLSSDTVVLPQVDCTKTYPLTHNAFQTDPVANSNAVGWPTTNPCGG